MTQDILLPKTILTYGTYDVFHIGHVRLFKRLKALGTRLIVGVSSDEFNEKKGKKTIIPYAQRTEIIESLECVDLVITENNWEQKIDDIKKYQVDVFAMGDDWIGKFDDLKEFCEVLYLPRTESISSTEIRRALEDVLKVDQSEVRKHFAILSQLSEDLR